LALQAGDTTVETFLREDAPHASDLLGSLVEALERQGWNKRDLRRVYVGIGPGSFTGLRVAAAVALGLAQALDVDLVAVPSVAAAAWAGLQVGEIGSVVLDARGGALYLGTYERLEQGIREVLAPTRIRLAEAKGWPVPAGPLLGEERAPAWLGVEANPNYAWRGPAIPTAAGILNLGRLQWQQSGASPMEAIRPLYLAAFGA